MNINVPPSERVHFWEPVPDGHEEFWAFRWPPPCKVGDPLYFRFDKNKKVPPVARAIVSRIEKPGEHKCERSGRFGGSYKIYWDPDSFEDLRLAP